jgi:hypothetical protein
LESIRLICRGAERLNRMKLVTEYLQQAVQFEQMAKEASDPTLKEQLLKQAGEYHRLAKKRSRRTRLA